MRFESFTHMLQYHAAARPGSPALKYGDAVLSFAELAAKVKDLAERYSADKKTCLAVLSDGSLDCVLNIFAANAAGLTAVMLDASLPEELLAKLIAYTESDALWTSDEELAESLKKLPKV